ncbi:MAG: hypothetical protein SO542_05600, partial [Muribaculaceae bacterium]|nr:hypothetical protein [Muribaculaceae bacterium]
SLAEHILQFVLSTDFTDFGYARLGVFLTTDFTDFTDFGYARLGVFLTTDFTDLTDFGYA